MLIKCPSCGTPVSDKAAKCPRCGASLKQDAKQNNENSGIQKVLSKAAIISSRHPNAQVYVSVFPDNFAIEPLIRIRIDAAKGDDSKANKTTDDFEEIIHSEFPQYEIRKNIAVTELVGDTEDRFKLYNDRPEQMYKAQWGKPFSFVLYQNNKAVAVIMLGEGHSHNHDVKYLISRMYCHKINIPYINFYTQFPNTRSYVINRINKFLNLAGASSLSIQVKEEYLEKMNLVSDFEALTYYPEFSTAYSSGEFFKSAEANDAIQAGKIVTDILTIVFKKKIESIRLVISIADDIENSSKYNAEGDFLEGKGYGQGEFAYYKAPKSESNESYSKYEETTLQPEENGINWNFIWWILGGIIWLIWIVS